jgi:alpha-galactosidase
MGARFGFDLDPVTLSPAERAACRRAALVYSGIRDLVQFGDLFRLIGPDEPGGRAALGFAGTTRRRGVVLGYQLSAASDPVAATCPVPWATSELTYRIQQLTLTSDAEQVTTRPGADLLAEGLPWPLAAARSAVIWLVDAEP